MDNINDILNRIGDFHLHSGEQEFDLTGTLIRNNNNIVLKARTARENLEYINQNDTFQIWGAVDGTPVTLLESLITRYFASGSSLDYGNISAEPTEIIIGRCYAGDINVTGISSSIEALNYMFSERLFKENFDFSKENPSVLDFAYPQAIKAHDSDGEVCISRGFQQSWSRNKIEYTVLPNIEYIFSSPVEIRTAIAKIASVRNLLSFFADYYLPLENITFSDDKTPKVEGVSGIFDCTLFLNNSEDIDIPQRPFLIMTNKFARNFSTIWFNWLQFYNGNKYIPTLFYEIISNRSTRINCFLNLTQAIESYSNYYRNEEAACVARSDRCARKEIPLKYRIKDILVYLEDCLDISPDKTTQLSQAISDARNFFTHYNEKKYKKPSVQEVLAANRVLRYVLLSIVYRTIGISSNDIKECKKYFEYSTFERDITVILKEKKDIEYSSWFE